MKALDDRSDVVEDGGDPGTEGGVTPMRGGSDSDEAFRAIAFSNIDERVMRFEERVLERGIIEVKGLQDGTKEAGLWRGAVFGQEELCRQDC